MTAERRGQSYHRETVARRFARSDHRRPRPEAYHRDDGGAACSAEPAGRSACCVHGGTSPTVDRTPFGPGLDVAALQRSVGNRAVVARLAGIQRAEALGPLGPPPATGDQPTIRQGSQGPAVVEAQTKLNAAGAAPPLVADGIFGPLTHDQVVAFQGSHDLVPDGIIGPKTWDALDAVDGLVLPPGGTGPGELPPVIDPQTILGGDPSQQCQPFEDPRVAEGMHTFLRPRVVGGSVVATKCGDVRGPWSDYFDRTAKPHAFSTGCVVEAAQENKVATVGAQQRNDIILANIEANLPELRKRMTFDRSRTPAAVLSLPVEEAVSDPAILHANLVFDNAFNAAANLAGGVGRNGEGSDVFGDDDRVFSGTVVIVVEDVHPETGALRGRMVLRPQIHVKDTVDFCPGILGNFWQEELTLPMSRLEAGGLVADVPITIDYTGPVGNRRF